MILRGVKVKMMVVVVISNGYRLWVFCSCLVLSLIFFFFFVPFLVVKKYRRFYMGEDAEYDARRRGRRVELTMMKTFCFLYFCSLFLLCPSFYFFPSITSFLVIRFRRSRGVNQAIG